jgi:CheY-like chemotaxis protein
MPDPVSRSTESREDDDAMDSVQGLEEEFAPSPLGNSAVVMNPGPQLSENLHENPYILLITDDKAFGEQVTHALDRLHYRTAMIYTTDTAAAISRCAAERPDMAILNVDSLSLGGIGLSRRLKADTPNLKVLSLVHGRELEAARKESEVSGSDAVCGLLDLPLQLDTIIKDLLSRRRQDKEAAAAEPSLTLQDRIRVEASAFDFSALLDGVTADAPQSPLVEVEPAVAEAESAFAAAEATESRVTPEAVTERRTAVRRSRGSIRPLVVALFGVGAVVATIVLMNQGVLQSGSVLGRGAASKPDISLTARKGLPYPPLTPGDRIATARAQADIPAGVQLKVFESYGLTPADTHTYVLVRLIPAGLGGTEDAKNLFPTTPWFAGLKARLDKRLIQLVESGGLKAEQAEMELKENWVRATHRYYIRNYGIEDPDAARKEEEQNKW